MTREKIREKTMQIIFQMDVKNDFNYHSINFIDENLKILKQKQAIETFDAIKEHIDDIDNCIISNTDGWTIDRIAKTDLAILRNAVAEIMYIESIPNNVSVNEAVELAKKFSSDKSYAFVNSVLGKIVSGLEDK